MSVDWVSEARRSRFWKRSLALMPFWAVCLGTSNLPPKVKLDLAPSYTNSTGKQSWPCGNMEEIMIYWLRKSSSEGYMWSRLISQSALKHPAGRILTAATKLFSVMNVTHSRGSISELKLVTL